MVNPQDTADSKDTAEQSQKDRTLSVVRIYIKNSLFEAAALTLEIIKTPATPTIDLQVQVNFSEKENHHYGSDYRNT